MDYQFDVLKTKYYETEIYNYISSAKDQCEQGPCGIFAAVAAVEALSHIYYHKPFTADATSGVLNLAEAEIYSGCGGYGRFDAAAGIEKTLLYIDTTGIINENCFQFPDTCFRVDCDNICENPEYVVNIPGFEQLYLSSDQELKRAIIDYGPIAVSMENIGSILHSGGGTTAHSILIIGWSSSSWHIKDSWPGDAYINYKSFNVFNATYNGTFWRAKYDYNNEIISCSGSDCSLFSSRSYTDDDEDGFYNWGIGPKPAGCPGPCQMDFDDKDSTTIFLNANYNKLPAPELNGPDYACYSGTTYELDDVPPGFSVQWEVSPSSYFNSPTSGNTASATIYPKHLYTACQASITFTISDGCGSVEYSKTFEINGPEPEGISIDVEESYGYPPVYYYGTWLLCPNSSYYIYLENNTGCSTSNYQWDLPANWTKYSQSDNYVRINTNNYPSGVVYVTATNSCCDTSYVIKTQYFGESYNCGGYFMYYPNPATLEINIELSEDVDLKEKNTELEIYDSGFNKIYVANKIQKKIKIKTGNWKNDFYYIMLKYQGKVYSEKIKVEN